jgi:prepilin-type N-terminal cleavage/methylation domain-containing protein
MTRPRTARVCPPPHRTSTKAPRAFTLIELLVVIAIIAILIGLLVPGLGMATRRAKDAKCLSNLKQIAMGWNMYLDDKEKFPKAGGFSWGGVDWYQSHEGQHFTESRPINPYIGAELRERARMEVFMCPRDDGFRRWNGGDVEYVFEEHSEGEDKDFTLFGRSGTSYTANDWAYTVVGAKGQTPPPTFNITANNSRVMAVAHDKFPLVGDTGSFIAGRTTIQGRAAANFAYGWWHGEQVCQMAMLDGSARAYTLEIGTAATRDYYFYLNPFKQPANSWVYASAGTGTPPAPTHPFAYDWDYSDAD